MAVDTTEIRTEPMDVTWGATDLGATSGGVTVNLEVGTVEIRADQKYGQLQDETIISHNVTVDMTISQLSAAQWNTIVGDAAGGNHTPAAGTEVSGYGSEKLGTNLSAVALELVLKPVGSADDLRNLHFHKAYPVPGSVSFSGEDLSTMEISFRCITDQTKDSTIDLFVFGDGTQDLT